jgi:4-alpha-glucanotransferase
MMRCAAASVANTCIFPLQDILQLGSDARMNTPAAGVGNWTWRYAPGALHPDSAARLADLMAMTDRDGYEEAVEGLDAGKPTDEASKRAELGAIL